MTRQRKMILDELSKTTAHPTADELFARVRRRLPRISLGTVYRNLEVLTQLSMIKRIESTRARKRYDGDLTQHYHVRCIGCGRVADAGQFAVRVPTREAAKTTRYEIVGHTLEFTGYCPRCRSKAPTRGER